MTKFVETFLLLVIYFSSTSVEGSCWRYGHSCWGGHGKRAGAPIITPDPATAPLHDSDWDYTRNALRVDRRALYSGPRHTLDLKYDADAEDIVRRSRKHGGKNADLDFFSYLTRDGEVPSSLETGEQDLDKWRVGEEPKAKEVYVEKSKEGDSTKVRTLLDWLNDSTARDSNEDNANYYMKSSLSPSSFKSQRNNLRSLYRLLLLRSGK